MPWVSFSMLDGPGGTGLQPEGLPMGSPISSILAEIFIHHFEQTHILNEQNNEYANKILYWYRYVDDILLIEPPGSISHGVS